MTTNNNRERLGEGCYRRLPTDTDDEKLDIGIMVAEYHQPALCLSYWREDEDEYRQWRSRDEGRVDELLFEDEHPERRPVG